MEANVIVAGYTDEHITGEDFLIIKYSGAGAPQWTNHYNGPGTGNDEATGLGVDSGGNVFITGSSCGSDGFLGYCTIKYSSAGVPLWTNRYHGLGNNDDRPTGLAVDSGGNVIVTGGSYDYATIKYSSGNPRVAITPDGLAGYYLRFQGVGGTAYELQRAANVNGPWSGSISQTSPASGLVEFRDTSPPLGQAFYRVRVR